MEHEQHFRVYTHPAENDRDEVVIVEEDGVLATKLDLRQFNIPIVGEAIRARRREHAKEKALALAKGTHRHLGRISLLHNKNRLAA